MHPFQLILLAWLVSLNLSTHAAALDGCVQLAGKYSKQVGMDDTFQSNGLEITIDNNHSNLILKYNSDVPPASWNGWVESYIADGNPHPGDQNTGKSYTASCQNHQISIVRDGILSFPLITNIDLSGDQLIYEATVASVPAHRSRMQLKRVP